MLDRNLVEAAFFRDAYRTPLAREQASVVEIFFAVFGHHPLWMKRILVARNSLASLCGLDTATAFEIMKPEMKGRVIATICTTHNTFGKIYLFFIIPFHKWGVRRLMSRAIAAGRL